MNQGRIYTDEQTRATGDEVNPNQRLLEQMQALQTDMRKPAEEQRPPTRMERKMKRIFGSAGQTSQLFI